MEEKIIGEVEEMMNSRERKKVRFFFFVSLERERRVRIFFRR